MTTAALIYAWVATMHFSLFVGAHMADGRAPKFIDLAVYTVMAGLWPVCILALLWERWHQHKGVRPCR